MNGVEDDPATNWFAAVVIALSPNAMDLNADREPAPMAIAKAFAVAQAPEPIAMVELDEEIVSGPSATLPSDEAVAPAPQDIDPPVAPEEMAPSPTAIEPCVPVALDPCPTAMLPVPVDAVESEPIANESTEEAIAAGPNL